MTFPSSLNMLTSSMDCMGWTCNLLSAVCSFLSSVPALLWTFLTFRRGVPLPLRPSISPFHPARSSQSRKNQKHIMSNGLVKEEGEECEEEEEAEAEEDKRMREKYTLREGVKVSKCISTHRNIAANVPNEI